MTAAQQMSVVVVDDDPVLAAIVRAAMAEDWAVQLCPDGASGLLACAADAVGAVVLDVDMPGMDGPTVCRLLRRNSATADLPVVFLSGAAGLEARLACYAAGGDDFLAKPFDAQELRHKVARAVAARQRQRAQARQVDELMQAVMASAEIAGDAGLVLEFHRQAAGCDGAQPVARLLLDVLAGLGLEASLGPRAGWCSDHLLLFVRDLVLDRPPTMPRERADRMGRHIDTIALLQGADRQLHALEAQRTRAQLAGSRHTVGLVWQVLVHVAECGQVQRQSARQVFERLVQAVEDRFVSLGLTQAQEAFLSDLIRRHPQELQAAVDAGLEVERQLPGAIGQLGLAT